jgi:hypothetical protein
VSPRGNECSISQSWQIVMSNLHRGLDRRPFLESRAGQMSSQNAMRATPGLGSWSIEEASWSLVNRPRRLEPPCARLQEPVHSPLAAFAEPSDQIQQPETALGAGEVAESSFLLRGGYCTRRAMVAKSGCRVCSGRVMGYCGKGEASEESLPVSQPTGQNRSNRLATLLRRAIIARL